MMHNKPTEKQMLKRDIKNCGDDPAKETKF